MAALVSYGLNRLSLKRLGKSAVTLEGPVAEELLKTFSAVLMGAPIIWTHVVFGLIEAAYDVFMESAQAESAYRSTIAAALSILGHSLFGIITFLGHKHVGYWQAGVLLAILVHAAWNRTLVSSH